MRNEPVSSENVVERSAGARVAPRVDDAARIQRLGAKIRALRKERGLTLKVLAQLSGRMRRFRIKFVPGDRVTVGVSPYDPVRGIITFRAR